MWSRLDFLTLRRWGNPKSLFASAALQRRDDIPFYVLRAFVTEFLVVFRVNRDGWKLEPLEMILLFRAQVESRRPYTLLDWAEAKAMQPGGAEASYVGLGEKRSDRHVVFDVWRYHWIPDVSTT